MAMRKESDNQQLLTISAMDKNVRQAFAKIKEEFEEHLTAINENTDELNFLHNHLGELDEKIEKLNARMDTIHMMFQQLIMQTRVSVELSLQEQRIFTLLYLHPYLSMTELAGKTALSSEEVEEQLTSLSDKGIPFVKKTKDGDVYVRLDDDFRKLQEKQQMVKVNPAIMQQMENKVLQNFFN